MKIVVNDIAASTGGAMTVLRDFYECVCRNDKENQWVFLLGDRYFPETDNVKIIPMPQVKKSGVKKLLFDFVTGRKLINSLQPDVVLSLQNIITFGVKAPQAVYIHQSIPFQTWKRFSFLKRRERKLAVIQYGIGAIIKRSAKKSSKVIVQTRWIKEALCQQCKLSGDRVEVVLPQVEATVCQDVCFDRNSFFYPTAQALYKNNDCIFAASRLLEQEGLQHTVTLTLPPEKTAGSVACIGRIPREQVLERYCGATLVFPSYIETFGYPLVEAKKCGTLVLASDYPFSREVLEGYENAYFFDPFRPEQLAQLMKQVISGQIVPRPVKDSGGDVSDSWLQVVQAVISMG